MFRGAEGFGLLLLGNYIEFGPVAQEEMLF